VNASHIFEHIRDPIYLLEECHRVMDKDAFLMVRLPHPSDFNSMWGHPEHKRPLPIDWWCGECERLGLEIMEYRISTVIKDGCSGWKHIISLVLDTIINDIIGTRLWERLNWITCKEMRLWIKKK